MQPSLSLLVQLSLCHRMQSRDGVWSEMARLLWRRLLTSCFHTCWTYAQIVPEELFGSRIRLVREVFPR
jgi:hypothetical protein